jgi:monoterpene epsilon-lactone hydrolase
MPAFPARHTELRNLMLMAVSSMRKTLVTLAALMIGVVAFALTARAVSEVAEDGSVRVPSVNVPFSNLASPEARAAFILGIKRDQEKPANPSPDITESRQWVDDTMAKPWVRQWRAKFPVTITPVTIGGVQTDVIEPTDGVSGKNKKRVLINLHGGGFVVGARYHGQAESIPIAALGHIKVITVAYALAPEHHFPAASEDVAAVYKALLRQYRPENIGIYGCSAGGMLTAESVAWFQTHGLQRAGAVGIFGAGGVANRFGDSNYFAPGLQGNRGPALDESRIRDVLNYFSTANFEDPMVSPADSMQVLRRFPPTLLITGTRDLSLSPAVYMDTQLTKAGAYSELHVWDGMGHCFVIDTEAPETRDAWEVIVRFFDRHLGKTNSE